MKIDKASSYIQFAACWRAFHQLPIIRSDTHMKVEFTCNSTIEILQRYKLLLMLQ